MTGLLLAIPALAIGAAGAWFDISQRRLPNLICLLMAIACAARLAYVGGWPELGSAGIHALIALAIGLALFAIRWIGGGDAKFYTAAALGVPMDHALTMLLWTSVSGAVLVFIILAARIRKGRPSANGTVKKSSVPFGVAIFAGYASTLL